MEIVLAVLLLFGGFTLGSITAEKESDDSPPTTDLPNAYDIPDSPSVTQAMPQCDPILCHSDKAVIYRDLTVPYQVPVGESSNE